MVDDRRVVLVTRPQAEAADTAAQAERLGFRAVLAPSLRIENRTLHLPPKMRLHAILVTSGNALLSLPASLHGVKLLAVGDATAERARQAGFAHVHSAGRDAAALETLVGQHCAPERGTLLMAVGAGNGARLAENLRTTGFAVLRRVAYAARPVTLLPEPARQALAEKTVAAALFFSPASARAFLAAVQRGGLSGTLSSVEAVAISQPTADALRLLPWRSIRVASRPDQDALMEWLR
jgi:uroporphyrinogen-III synthase